MTRTAQRWPKDLRRSYAGAHITGALEPVSHTQRVAARRWPWRAKQAQRDRAGGDRRPVSAESRRSDAGSGSVGRDAWLTGGSVPHHYEIHRFCHRANEAQKTIGFSHPRLSAADEKWLARKKVTAEEALARAFQIRQGCGLAQGDLFILTLDGNIVDAEDEELTADYRTYSDDPAPTRCSRSRRGTAARGDSEPHSAARIVR